MVMKGLPLAYAKDMQEDKEVTFDALASLRLGDRRHDRHGRGPGAQRRGHAGGGRPRLLHRDRPRRLAGAELGLPFREAHHVTGRIVAAAEAKGVPLDKLPLADMQAI